MLIDKKITYVLMYGTEVNGYVRKDGTAQIYIRAYKNDEFKYIGTRINLLPNQWKNGAVVKHPNARELNQRLREQLNILENNEAEQRKKYGKVNIETLERALQDNGKNDVTFTAFLDSEVKRQPYTKETRKAHQTTLNKLKDCFKKDIYFDDLNYTFLKNFEDFLIKQNLHQNTIHKHFKNIKAHLNEAIRHDYFDLNKNPFLKYSPKRVATHKEPLTEKELEYLEQWTASSAERHLEPIRDFFLISCYSGLRFSDIQALNLRNFSDTPEGLFLSLEAQKTKKRYKVNSRLLFCRVGAEKSRLEMLLLKHIENMHGMETIPLFKYSNQYINRCLKQIFEQIPKIRIEFDEKISTHYGRHTFTNIMAKHVPAPILQKLLQHSSLQVTQGYINHSEDDLTNALSNVKIG